MTADLRDLLRAGPGPLDLSAAAAASTPGVPAGQGKAWARAELVGIGAELSRHQETLFAAAKTAAAGTVDSRRRVLLVLQGMDCSGKGGTVRKVAGTMNPQGVRVVGFGPPTDEEREHDFLWRIRRALPPAGQVGVFDRSHYEDVLVVRVHSMVPARVWRARYDQINEFERELVEGGMTLVKVMLHLSYREQKRRLRARLDDPTKHWKYQPRDVDERARWDDYQAAYADALTRCDTDHAPWYVVPADHKWYRDWAVARLLLRTFEDLGLSYPAATFDVAQERARLEASSKRKVNGK